ncbi:MAG: hypothetical protein IKF72_07255 [Kiritimatiellae bacterium]|nr:hypothetical protein [Kiritimatiellia bacterium]
MEAISLIAGLLSLCGISSMRMFAPTFLFGAICRFLPAYSWCPSEISALAESCPPFLTGDFGLCVFGVLGVLEVVANWEDSVRELISETNIETYAKPLFAVLVSYSILTPEQMQVLSAAVNGVPDAMSMACDPVTANAVTSSVSAVTSGLDVNAVSNAVGVAVQGQSGAAPSTTALSFAAIAASLFCGGGTLGLCKFRAHVVAAVRELDPDNTLRLNTLLTLFEEGSWLAILPVMMVFPLAALLLMVLFAVFGWVFSIPLRKIAEERRARWDAVGKDGMLKAVRTRAVAIFALGAFLSSIPVFGYLVTVVALNLLVFSVIAMYEKPAYRMLVRLAMRFIKLTLFLVAIVFSCIPFLGILLLLPYLVSFVMRTRKIESCSPHPTRAAIWR